MSNIVAFIPARGGSKSIPRKNIKELGGKPLIAWTIESAFDAGLQRVIVNTDDDEIAGVAREYGAEIMMRPQELAQDETSMLEVLKSEVPKIIPAPKTIVLLQPTSPFREVGFIRKAVDSFDRRRFDSLISVESVPEKYNPAQVIVNNKMADGRPIAERITQRQKFPQAFIPTGSLYLFKPSNLERGSIYGEKIFLLQSDPTININSPEDWEDAEQYVRSH